MRTGHLSEYFEGVAVKRLTAVEVDPATSNQHEFNGAQELKELFGMERQKFPARFIYLGIDDERISTERDFVTWYDARENHPVRSEHRLYFPSNSVTESASEGDLLIIATRSKKDVLVVIAQASSTYESQLLWLFGFPQTTSKFQTSDLHGDEDKKLEFATRLILESIGVEVESADENWLDRIFAKFGEVFPVTRVFSSFARETATEIDVLAYPDSALMSWIDHEEMLFRTLEKHIVEKRLEYGFTDVDDFISYSLSIQNRRKSRVGHALENHLEHLFSSHSIKYSRGALTENRAKPDFLFPGITYYRKPEFPDSGLTMLGVKSTCKDRWRQVLSEAQRIDSKHLFTLEPGISTNQTEEMQSHSLQLVLPEHLHETYNDSQRSWLMSLSSFIEVVRNKQD